jgi:hypothetical protein
MTSPSRICKAVIRCTRVTAVASQAVGTWGFGPFEDDTAVDFVDELREAVPAVARQRLIRALEDCADGRGIDDYVSAVEGCAAAALLVRYVDDELGPEEVQWRCCIKRSSRSLAAKLLVRSNSAAQLGL